MKIKLVNGFGGVLLCLLVVPVFTLGLFYKKIKMPGAVVFSLSKAQVYKNSTPDALLRFFQQKRFKNLGLSSEVLFEVRCLKTLVSRHKAVTLDFTLYLIIHIVKRSCYFHLLYSILSSTTNRSITEIILPRQYKHEILDRIIWSHVLKNSPSALSVVTTQSSLEILPEVFYLQSKPPVRRIMIWYSTNSKPIKKLGEEFVISPSLKKLKEIEIEHWVWNDFEAAFLANLGVRLVKSLGSLVLQEEELKRKTNDSFVITFFDVTPMAQAKDFYEPYIAMNNLECIFEMTKQLQDEFGKYLQLRVKPKRRYSKIHSQGYINKMNDGVHSGLVELLNPHTNLYSVISESDLVLSVPFTSPSVIARELDVPTFYCSFDSSDWDIPNNSSGISVIKTREALYNEVKTLMISKLDC